MINSAGNRRALLAAVPQPIAVVPAVALLVTAGARLPDPVASHFGPTGAANGFTSAGTLALVMSGLAVGLAAVFGGCTRSSYPRRPAGSRFDLARWFVGIAWATAALVGTLLWISVDVNLDLPAASAAVLPPTTFPLALAAAAAAGLVGGLLAPRSPVASAPAPVPAAELGATEQVSWSRSVGAPWVPVGGAVLLAAGLALAVAVQPATGAGLAVAGIVGMLFGRVRVVVDRRGLTVTPGLVGRPRLHVPAGDVESVTVEEVSPAQFGGWGYRIVPGGRAVIMRSGEALVVTRRSAPRLTVTVDDAATAAGLLSAVAAKAG